jgi:predicted permease
MYRLLLRLLPRHRRAQYGDEMEEVFAMTLKDAKRRGRRASVALWVSELVGVVTFAIRQRLQPFAGGRMTTDLRWASKAVRSQWHSHALSIGLLVIAITANGVIFAAVDSLYLEPYPYPEPERIVSFRNAADPNGPPFAPRAVIQAVHERTDLFDGVVAYATTTVFLTGDAPERVRTVNITPGLLATLGVKVAWGRDLTDADVARVDVDSVLIGESLARTRFGDPGAAVGRQLASSDVPLVVVGVMPTSFRFNDGGIHIWRGIDLDGPVGRERQTYVTQARLRGSISTAAANDALASMAFPSGWRPEVFTFTDRRPDPIRYYALLGAGLCLWLTACTNVVTIQLALATARRRTVAIQRALGATRGSMVRAAGLECGLVVGTAAAVGVTGVWLLLPLLVSALPASFAVYPINPIDLDVRVLTFVVISVITTWILAAMPSLLIASRSRLLDILSVAGRTQTGSRAAQWTRQVLTSAQIAIAVVLLIGCLLFTRTYLQRVAVDKGFDAANLVEVSVLFPPQSIHLMAQARPHILARIAAHPAVHSTLVGSVPSSGNSPFSIRQMAVDGKPFELEGAYIRVDRVNASYHQFFRMPLLDGRYFSDNEPDTSAIVSETFARRFLPEGAVGRRLKLDDRPEIIVVGVVPHARTSEERSLGRQTPVIYTVAPTVIAPPVPRVPSPVVPGQRRLAGAGNGLRDGSRTSADD